MKIVNVPFLPINGRCNLCPSRLVLNLPHRPNGTLLGDFPHASWSDAFSSCLVHSCISVNSVWTFLWTFFTPRAWILLNLVKQRRILGIFPNWFHEHYIPLASTFQITPQYTTTTRYTDYWLVEKHTFVHGLTLHGNFLMYNDLVLRRFT